MKRYAKYSTSFNGYIKVEHHAIERFKHRLNMPDMDDKEVIHKIINQVRYSKLIAINGKEEHRSHNGNIYVVVREYEKDTLGLLKEKIVVVTMKLSKVKIRENFSDDFSMNTVDIDRLLGTNVAC